MASDIETDGREHRADYSVKPVVPEPILIMIKNYYERKGQMIPPKNKPLQVG